MLLWFLIVIAAFPIWGSLLWYLWDACLKPQMIPAVEIQALADVMIAQHGPQAERMAFAEEDRAWCYVDGFAQGKWRRVRRELWRRYETGEWAGPD